MYVIVHHNYYSVLNNVCSIFQPNLHMRFLRGLKFCKFSARERIDSEKQNFCTAAGFEPLTAVTKVVEDAARAQ